MPMDKIYKKTRTEMETTGMADEPRTITIKQNTAVNISLAILIMLAGALITATTMFVELRGQVSINKLDLDTTKGDIGTLKAENTLVKVEIAKVQAQLTSIESHLIDIKEVQKMR